jgi:hypothetical protein
MKSLPSAMDMGFSASSSVTMGAAFAAPAPSRLEIHRRQLRAFADGGVKRLQS